MCESVIFSLGAESFGFEAARFTDYRQCSGPYRAIPGAPSYVLGYARYEGKEVLVQDLRIRFGTKINDRLRGQAGNLIIFRDGAHTYGFIVDVMLDICSARQPESTTHWGMEVLLDTMAYKPFVDRWVQTTVAYRTVNFWLLRLEDLYPQLKSSE